MSRKILFLKYPWGVSWTGMLLIAGEQNILMDTGLPETIGDFLLPRLRCEGVSPGSLKWVLNTHSHSDHAGGNRNLRGVCHAVFGIHRSGAEELRRSGCPPDLLLEDGMVLPCGDTRIRVIHTPGHSPDSVCYLDVESGTLFTGDALQGGGTPYSGIALYQDPVAYRESVDRIEALYRSGACARIFCGHECPPYEGTVEGTRIPEFLSLCRDASLRYTSAAGEYLGRHPDADAGKVGAFLLAEFGVGKNPSMPELPRLTAEAHLRELRGCGRRNRS